MADLPEDHVVETDINTKGFASAQYEIWRTRESNPRYWDIMLHTIDKKEIPASRKDLSVFSPVFKTMLSGHLKEAETGIVDVNWRSETVENFLDTCYAGKVRQAVPSSSPPSPGGQPLTHQVRGVGVEAEPGRKSTVIY
jgi:hypothetical protein